MKTIITDIFQIEIPIDFDEPVIDPIGFKATMSNTGAKIQEPLLDAVLCKVSELNSDTYKGETLEEKYEDWALSLNYKAEKLSFEKTEVNGYETFIVNAHTDAAWTDKHFKIRYFQAALFLGDGYFLDIRGMHEKIKDNALADWVLDAFESVKIVGDTSDREKAYQGYLLAQQEKNKKYQEELQQRRKKEEAKKNKVYDVAIPKDGEELFKVGDFDFEFVPKETNWLIGSLSKDLQVTLKAKTKEVKSAVKKKLLDDYKPDGSVSLTIPAKGIHQNGIPTGRLRFEEEKTNAPLFLHARSEGFDYSLAFTGVVVLKEGWVLLSGEMTKSYHSKSFPIRVAKRFDVETLNWNDYQYTSMDETATAQPEAVRFLSLQNPKFTKLPEAIFAFENLEEMYISKRSHYGDGEKLPLHEIQQRIGELSKLRNLHITAAALKELPESISSLLNLEQLSLGNCLLEAIPEGIFKLPKLKYLWAGKNRLTEIPEEINLPSVENISLNGNLIKTLPATLAEQPKLNKIDLKDNPWESLPENFNSIKAVELAMEDKLRLLDFDYKGADGEGLFAWDDTVFYAKQDADLLAEIDVVIKENKLSDKSEALRSLVKKAIGLTHEEEEDYTQVGNHRFGGMPDLPLDVDYPEFYDDYNEATYKYEFIGQINCTEIADLQEYLPRKGMLYFFLETLHNVYGGNTNPCKVLYCEDASTLVSGKQFQFSEKDYFEMIDGCYSPYKVIAKKMNSAPSLYASYVNTHVFRGAAESLKDDDKLLEELYDTFEAPMNKLNTFQYAVNAYGFTQHEAPELQASLAKKGNPEDWMTLMVVTSAGDMQWGDAGDLFFVIHKSDLAKGDFSNVFVTMESS